MDREKDQAIRARAYRIWEEEGRPHGRHHEHWLQACQDLGITADTLEKAAGSPPGMLGDGTEEQNLDQPGTPGARITQAEVEAAFGTGRDGKGDKPAR